MTDKKPAAKPAVDKQDQNQRDLSPLKPPTADDSKTVSKKAAVEKEAESTPAAPVPIAANADIAATAGPRPGGGQAELTDDFPADEVAAAAITTPDQTTLDPRDFHSPLPANLMVSHTPDKPITEIVPQPFVGEVTRPVAADPVTVKLTPEQLAEIANNQKTR